MRRYILLFSFSVVLSLTAFSQNAFWSNTGLVSLKPGAYLSIIGDAYNQDSGVYDNNDSIFLTGNWSHTAPNRCFDSIGAGWVYLYADSQHVTGTNSTHFYNLVLQNRGVKYGDLDVYVDGQLQLNDREFSMDTNTVWVLNPDTGAVTRSTGYVSSLNNGGLLRRTNAALPYLFAVGSNVGTFRYRPVEFDPLNANVNQYKVRFANVDPTSEGYNRSIKDLRVCQLNPVWYHRLYHQSGSDSANITIMYDTTADGSWSDIAHWQNLPEWESIHINTNVPGTPFNRITKYAWNNYNYAPFDLAVTSSLTITGTATDAGCYEAQTGSITISVLNAESSYTVTWSNGDTGQTITGLGTGTYIVTVSEADHCDFSDTFTVNQPPPLRVNVTESNVTCYGGHNGEIQLSPVGGTPPYTYYWSDSAHTQQITELDSNTYYFLVTDSNGCRFFDSVNISQPSPLIVDITKTNAACYGAQNGQIALKPSGDTPPYTYNWSNSATTQQISNLYSNTYYFTVTDVNGCTVSDSANIGQPPRAPYAVAGVDTIIWKTDTIQLNGFLGASYSWSPDFDLSCTDCSNPYA